MTLRALIVQASLGAMANALAVTIVPLIAHASLSPASMTAVAGAGTIGSTIGLVMKWRRSQHSGPS